jgi:putative endonuclease
VVQKRGSRRSSKAKKYKNLLSRKSAGMQPTPCFCYMVECSDGTLYTGWTTDTDRRIKVHNAGRGGRYTSTRLPVTLVYVEPQPDRTSAMKREYAIKRLTRQKKQELIERM